MKNPTKSTPQVTGHVPEFYRIFTLIDKKNDGYLDKTEIKDLLMILGKSPTDNEINQILEFIRGSSGGTEQQPIDFSVFLAWIYRSLELVSYQKTRNCGDCCFLQSL